MTEVKIMYRIYGKHKTQKKFKPMNLSKGTQVTNLIYASMLTPEEKEKCMAEMATGINPDWQFDARQIIA